MTTEHFLTINDVRYRYLIDGHPEDRPLLLLHGGGSSAKTWTAFVDAAVGRGFHTIRPDLRGHGQTGRSNDYALARFHADAEELVDRLDLRGVDVVGHSLGGHVAIALATHRPDRVRRLILEEPPPPPRIGRREGWRRRFTILQMVFAGFRHSSFDPAAIRAVVTELRNPDAGWWQQVSRISAPTLLIAGGSRSHISQLDLQHLAAVIPRCQFTVISVGHRVHSRASHRFIETALAFLDAPPQER